MNWSLKNILWMIKLFYNGFEVKYNSDYSDLSKFKKVRRADLSFREARNHGNENSRSAILNFWAE